MKIFLDDVRYPDNCTTYMTARVGKQQAKVYDEGRWKIARSYNDFVELIIGYAGDIDLISFDHDLEEDHYAPEELYDDPAAIAERLHSKENTGFECAKYLKFFYEKNKIVLPRILIHSMNPVGVERIKSVFNTD